jgi:hypothetical protein
MDFNFDSDVNIKTSKTPSVKPINKDIIDPNGAGLWIANENAGNCGWIKNSAGEYLNTIPYSIKTDKVNEEGLDIVIPGRVIVNPRMLILQRSLLLKVVTKTGRILRAWIANESKEGDMYACVRKYMILFVDQDNNPLHKIPVQLTARGCFQFEFDKQLCGFRTTMLKAYNEDQKKSSTHMKDYWYSMCVFVPTFNSMMRGKDSKQQKACITTGYKNPTKENWLSLCVGKRYEPANQFWSAAPESLTYAQYVYQLYLETKTSCESKGWWRRTNLEQQCATVNLLIESL